jgi:hypothetical protein
MYTLYSSVDLLWIKKLVSVQLSTGGLSTPVVSNTAFTLPQSNLPVYAGMQLPQLTVVGVLVTVPAVIVTLILDAVTVLLLGKA